jgi:hypothetical protein
MMTSENKKTGGHKTAWEIAAGMSGVFAVLATIAVALITYNQNLKIVSAANESFARSRTIKSQIGDRRATACRRHHTHCGGTRQQTEGTTGN